MKHPRVKPVYGFMVARGSDLDENSFEYERAPIVARLNRPAGERVVAVRISEMKAPARAALRDQKETGK